MEKSKNVEEDSNNSVKSLFRGLGSNYYRSRELLLPELIPFKG